MKIISNRHCIPRKSYRRHISTNILEKASISLENPKFDEYIGKIVSEYNEAQTNNKTSSSAIISKLTPVIDILDEIKSLKNDIKDLKTLEESENDSEMQKLALSDIKSCQQKLTILENELVDKIIELETNSITATDIELEISAGAGGQEAMLFCKEVFEMYQSYSLYRGWEWIETSAESNSGGGYRRCSASIIGDDVYASLKFEGGVHRVQRIPVTEKAGRMHTSTISVSIVPQPKDIDIVISNSDLKIETMRAGGAGGQHVNTTDSAVRITHLPTKTVVECQNQRSQISNKKEAMNKLRTILYQQLIDDEMNKYNIQRKLQIGNKARNEKIRTYNYQQDRMTDHRIGLTQYNISSILSGGDFLHQVIEQVNNEAHKEQIMGIIRSLSS